LKRWRGEKGESHERSRSRRTRLRSGALRGAATEARAR
jgi:hypothetical protein